MKQKLINALKSCGFVEGATMFLQGTISPDERSPETFVTFWVDSTENNGHFDNAVVAIDWAFSVMLYSNDPATVNTKPNEIRTALTAAGFIPQGKGHDIYSDEPTHTGWAMDFIFTEYQ